MGVLYNNKKRSYIKTWLLNASFISLIISFLAMSLSGHSLWACFPFLISLFLYISSTLVKS